MSWRKIGKEQVEPAIYRSTTIDQVVRETGIYGISYLVELVLDEHYPKDVFKTGWSESHFGMNWAGEHGGADVDPGVKWATLLRLAIEELDKIEKAKEAG